MSKELEALENIGLWGYQDSEGDLILCRMNNKEDFAIIETALKEHEEYVKADIKVCAGSLLTCQDDFKTIWDEFKALEIIKSCIVGEFELKDHCDTNNAFNSPYRSRIYMSEYEYNEWILKNKEEFDLLKRTLHYGK